MLVCLAELVDLASHEGHDAESELLSLRRFAVVLADQGDQSLCKSDESYTEGSMVDDRFDGIVLAELLAVQPQCTHQQRELLLEGCLLEVEPLVELLCGNLQCPVELVEEFVDPLLLVLYVHALDGELHDVDGSERKVASSD